MGYQCYTWIGNFGFSVFLSPVIDLFAPLPTRVLYAWKPDAEYSAYSDRAQNTLMSYRYNVDNPDRIRFPAGSPPDRARCRPASPSPPNSDTSFLYTVNWDGAPSNCIGPNQGFDFPQRAAELDLHPRGAGNDPGYDREQSEVLGPNTTVTIFSVLFPPAPPNYPDSTYLWTWYAPQNATGTESRPITFMQSQSGVNVGTSLALADYFYYQNFVQPINPANFEIPYPCSRLGGPSASGGKRDRPVSRRSTALVSR